MVDTQSLTEIQKISWPGSSAVRKGIQNSSLTCTLPDWLGLYESGHVQRIRSLYLKDGVLETVFQSLES